MLLTQPAKFAIIFFPLFSWEDFVSCAGLQEQGGGRGLFSSCCNRQKLYVGPEKKNARCTRGVCVALQKLLSLSLKLEEQGPKTISFP